VDRWARLTWQAGDPDLLARQLGERMGVTPTPSVSRAGVWDLWLGGELLEVVPWRREEAGDDPVGDGRLLFEPVMPGELPTGATGGAGDAGPAGGVELAAVVWATVDLERAEADLAPWLEPLAGDAPLIDEPHLGGRGRARATSALPGSRLVLLEPTTEGALAASLARDGEGPCGLYILPGAATPAAASAARRLAGPLGPSVRLRSKVRAGPHLLLLAPGTIAS